MKQLKMYKTHEELGKHLEDYENPTYISELEADGLIKIQGREFLPVSDFHVDLSKNWIRQKIDGDKSEEVSNEFATSFGKNGWDSKKGPICVVIQTLVDGQLKYWPMGYTHRFRGTEKANLTPETDIHTHLFDIPSLIISIVNDSNEDVREEMIIDLYTLEQSYERTIQYGATASDVSLTLERWQKIYIKRFPNWQTDKNGIKDLEDYLKDKIENRWKKKVTDSMLKKMALLIGPKSTYSGMNYSTPTAANNFLDKIYNGNFTWKNGCNLPKGALEFKTKNRESTSGIKTFDNDNTLYKSIFIYDDERNSGWMSTYNMLIKLHQEKSDCKLMVWFGIGGTSPVTNLVVNSRRKVWMDKWEVWTEYLSDDLKNYLHIGGWLASDTDKDTTSILNYDDVRRNNK
jgi:hypothetical protein|tara:strand:+ start:105 stop:1310 length:1206 start_codon:yes stop_codon:yes gene_type:complete